MFNYKLTTDFTLWEFFKTNQGLLYECEQVSNFGVVLRNIILYREAYDKPLTQTMNLITLANFLQMYRNFFFQPIIINSGLRSEELNKKVGGVENSKHLIGLAADITFSGYSTYLKPSKFGTPSKVVRMCEYLKDKKNSGFLSELVFHENYIHIAL